MSTTTPNLGLFKYNTDTDGKEIFSIQTALNNNWDLIDSAMAQSGSSGESGYAKLNNGLIINYGQASISSQEVTWTRPNLSENGTMGGNSCACTASTYYSSYYPWRAFDGSTGTGWRVTGNSSGCWLTFYSPIPIKVSQFTYTSTDDEWAKSFKLDASNDNSSWEQLGTYTKSIAAQTTHTVDTEVQGFYKYYRITTIAPYVQYTWIMELNFIATYITSVINSITFPQAFTSSNYAYSLAYRNGAFGESYATNLTSTGMTLQNNSNADAVYYIAIGY